MQRYITDESGVRTAVILSVEEYETLLQIAEDAEDERIAAESLAEMEALRDRTRETPARSLDDVVAEIEREPRSRHD
jgi:hypothetical protein